MLASLHAVAILATIVVPLIVIAISHQSQARPFRQAMPFVLTIAFLGLCCVLLLNMRGVPFMEWLFPLMGTILAAMFVKSQRAFNILRWALLLSAMVLSGRCLSLLEHGYTSQPERIAHVYDVQERGTLKFLDEQLRTRFAPDRVLPETPLKRVLPEVSTDEWVHREFRALWHTRVTWLYQEIKTPGQVWYPGGPVASAKLEWRATTGP